MSEQLKKLAEILRSKAESESKSKEDKVAHIITAARGLQLLNNKLRGNNV